MAHARTPLWKRALIVLAIAILALIAFGAWYVNDYYHADDTALAVMADEQGAADGVTVRELSGKAVAFVPESPRAGMIFYPGGKVQPEAYAPLLERCAEQGLLCVLVRPLFNLAVLDANCADGVIEQFPDVDRWIIAGHSLGGVMASDYLSRHEGDFEGIAFLAAYPLADLSKWNGTAVSLVGDADKVLDHDKYEEANAKMPADSRETGIEGGNHAQFGNYGEQAGDGQASITRDQQQKGTAAALVQLATGVSE